jgi:nitrite reductase (cytochrome c-552)
MSIPKPSKRTILLAALVGSIFAGVGIGLLLTNITERKMEGQMYPLMVVELGENEIDPEVWGRNFPKHYDSFMRTKIDSGRTKYGGSTPFDKLEANPFLRKAWAGYAFALDYNNARGHYYSQIDQAQTRRTHEVEQPGSCINCHAAEAPALIAELGWETFNRTPYNELRDRLHTGSSCADCHDPQTMQLRITRPAFAQAMARRGIDVNEASRQEMRSYVCAQCHVEYYFQGEDRILTFPWDQGLNIDDIEAYFDEMGFVDWTHAITKAPMLKAQHPEFELSSTGIHAQSGVSCADCHMPYTRVGGVKVSDHHIRSPLHNVNNACQTCHAASEQELLDRVERIQDRTYTLIGRSQDAISDAIDAIAAAMETGAGDDALEEARYLHRRAQFRWDFVYSENSMGFHSPQESARILADSIDYARRAELAAARAMGAAPPAPAVAEDEPPAQDAAEEAQAGASAGDAGPASE